MTWLLRLRPTVGWLTAALLVGTLISISTTGCRRRTYRPPTYNGAPGGGAGGGAADLASIERYLNQQGFRRATRPEQKVLKTNEFMSANLKFKGRSCYTVVALGPADGDVNMVLLDQDGHAKADNHFPDANPWVHVCPDRSMRATARVHMARGQGNVSVVSFRGRNPQPPLASYFPPTGATRPTPAKAKIDTETKARLTNYDETMSEENYGRIAEPAGVPLRRGVRQDFPIRVEGGGCYTYAAFGGPGVTDTRLALALQDGKTIAEDNESDPDAVVRLCPKETLQLVLQASVQDGNGTVFLAAYERGVSTAQATSDPSSNQSAPVGPAQANPGLDENVRRVDGDIRARGYLPMGQPMQFALDQGGLRELDVSLQGGRCYAVIAVGDRGIENLDVSLYGADGTAIDHELDEGSTAIVRACPDETGTHKLRVSMLRGGGRFVYAPYHWPRGTRGPFGLAGLIYVRLMEVTTLLGMESYVPDENSEPATGSLRRRGSSQTHQFSLAGGSCYALLAVGERGLNDIGLTLRENGKVVAQDESTTAFPDLRYCPGRSGEYVLQVTAEKGEGSYFFQVFRQQSEEELQQPL